MKSVRLKYMIGAALCLTLGLAQAQNSEAEDAAAVPPPPDGKAQLVVFRAKTFRGALFNLSLREGEDKLVTTRNGEYSIIPISAGKHLYRWRAPFGPNTFELDAEAGQTYFVSVDIEQVQKERLAIPRKTDGAEFEAALPKMKIGKP